MSFEDDLDKLFKKKNLFLFSILFTLNFYYFKFSTYESVNFKIKLPELIYLFFFQMIIFFLIEKIIKRISNFNLRKYLKFFFNTWFLVIVIQTCFFFYGGISLNDFLENLLNILNFKKIILLKPAAILFPYLISFFIIFFFNKKKISLIKFFKITTIIFLVFFFYREFFLYPDSYFPNIIQKKPVIQQSLKIKKNDPITLWVLFDEYDPNFIDELKLDNNLKYFNKLKQESLYFENVTPNAKQTKFSMMGILTGFSFIDVKIRNKEVFLINNNDDSLKYDFKKTIFQRLLNDDYNFTILSTVTKYCSVYFKTYALNNCFELPIKINFLNQLSLFNIDNYDGIFFHYSFKSYFKALLNLSNKKKNDKYNNNENYQKIINLDPELDVIDFDGNKFITSKKLKKIIDQRQHSLIFAHINLPHLPSKHSEKELNFELDNKDIYENYLLNLKYNDLVIKQLFEIQKEYKNVNLIISSDHWFRVKDMETETYYKSLLAVKLSDDKNYLKINKKYNASIISNIIESIILKKSRSYKNIIDNLDDIKYSEPCFNKNCLY